MPLTAVKVSTSAMSGRKNVSETMSWLKVVFLNISLKMTSCIFKTPHTQ